MSVHFFSAEKEKSHSGGTLSPTLTFGKVPREGAGVEKEMLPDLSGRGFEVASINKDLDRLFLELFEQMGLEAHRFSITMGQPEGRNPRAPRDTDGKLGPHDGILSVTANRFDRGYFFELFQYLHLAHRARVQDPIHTLEGFFEPLQLGRGQQGLCVR